MSSTAHIHSCLVWPRAHWAMVWPSHTAAMWPAPIVNHQLTNVSFQSCDLFVHLIQFLQAILLQNEMIKTAKNSHCMPSEGVCLWHPSDQRHYWAFDGNPGHLSPSQSVMKISTSTGANSFLILVISALDTSTFPWVSLRVLWSYRNSTPW